MSTCCPRESDIVSSDAGNSSISPVRTVLREPIASSILAASDIGLMLIITCLSAVFIVASTAVRPLRLVSINGADISELSKARAESRGIPAACSFLREQHPRACSQIDSPVIYLLAKRAGIPLPTRSMRNAIIGYSLKSSSQSGIKNGRPGRSTHDSVSQNVAGKSVTGAYSYEPMIFKAMLLIVVLRKRIHCG